MTTFRVIDIETTGMEPPAEIIEIGWQDVIADDQGVRLGATGSALYGALNGIPPETMAVHHITPAMVLGCPPCLRFDVDGVIAGADVLVAHNAAFEAQWFTPEICVAVPFLCTLKAASRVWPEAPGHSNSVLRYWLGHDLDERAMPPHRAQPDAYVTAHILLSLLERASAADMLAWTQEPRVMPTCPIGKFRGKPWSEVEAGFLNWMLAQATMEADLKWNARRELDRRAGR